MQHKIKGEKIMQEKCKKILTDLIEQANKNMCQGLSIGEKIEINKVEELCGHALDGTWIASCTGEFQSGNNTFLYNIDGVDDNYVMFNINVLDENKPIVSGVGMYGTIQELFYGFCRGIAKIEYDESIK